jgi:hypothetical protein
MLHSAHAARLAIAAAAALASSACASAGYKTALAGTDRPGYTYGTATVPVGGVQAEVGYTDTRFASTTYQTLGEGLLRIGVGPNTEFRAFANSYALRSDAGVSSDGLEDAKLGLKHKLWAGKGTTGFSGASIALLPAASIPIGSDGFSASVWQPELLVAAALPVTSKFSLVSNVGDVYVKLGPDREHKLLGTLAGWLTFSPKVSAFAEYAGSRIASVDNSTLHYFDAGVAVVVVPAIQLDVRVGQGANHTNNDRFIGVGISRRW